MEPGLLPSLCHTIDAMYIIDSKVIICLPVRKWREKCGMNIMWSSCIQGSLEICVYTEARLLQPISPCHRSCPSFQPQMRTDGCVKVFLFLPSRDTTELGIPCCRCTSIMMPLTCFWRVLSFCKAAAIRPRSLISLWESSPRWAVSWTGEHSLFSLFSFLLLFFLLPSPPSFRPLPCYFIWMALKDSGFWGDNYRAFLCGWFM